MGNQDCLICKKNKATKTNSHLIPSFMIAKVCSYDGSGKRDKEVMFTMESYEDRIYTGAIPDIKIEELFDKDKLTDERINKELKNNTASKDYIFCPECENNLSTYLESPYSEYLSNGKTLKADVAYFFWMSIVWRMSISKQFQFELPCDIEQSLGNCLHKYMNAITNKQDITPIIEKCNFSYRLLRCPSYLPNKMAYIGGRYREEKGILTLTLGDSILCVKFDNKPFPDDFSYLGLEETIKSASVNNGTSNEMYTEVGKNAFEKVMTQMVKEISLKRLINEKERADVIWHRVGLSGLMPDEIFDAFIDKLYSEDIKPGDRKTLERYTQVFYETLESFGSETKR